MLSWWLRHSFRVLFVCIVLVRNEEIIFFTNCLGDVSRESRMMKRDQRGILSLFFDDQRLSVLTSLSFFHFRDISWSISEYTYVVYSSVLTQCRSFFIPVANKHFLSSVLVDLSVVYCEMLNFGSFQTSRHTFCANWLIKCVFMTDLTCTVAFYFVCEFMFKS